MPAHSSPPLTGRGCNQLGTVEKSLRKGRILSGRLKERQTLLAGKKEQ